MLAGFADNLRTKLRGRVSLSGRIRPLTCAFSVGTAGFEPTTP